MRGGHENDARECDVRTVMLSHGNLATPVSLSILPLSLPHSPSKPQPQADDPFFSALNCLLKPISNLLAHS